MGWALRWVHKDPISVHLLCGIPYVKRRQHGASDLTDIHDVIVTAPSVNSPVMHTCAKINQSSAQTMTKNDGLYAKTGGFHN